MNNSKKLHAHEMELLHFIKPPGRMVELFNSKDGYIRQHYVFHKKKPESIVVREENTLYTSHSSMLYVFCINGRDLILTSCTEKLATGELCHYNHGYPYLRLPQSSCDQEAWEYQYYDNITVRCTSRYVMQNIGGIEYDALQVERIMEYSDSQITETHHTIEYYVAGLGIQCISDRKIPYSNVI